MNRKYYTALAVAVMLTAIPAPTVAMDLSDERVSPCFIDRTGGWWSDMKNELRAWWYC
jgi:hypothetical protein